MTEAGRRPICWCDPAAIMPSAIRRWNTSPRTQSAVLITTCLTVFDVLPLKFESPPYTALTDAVHTLRGEVERLAAPPLNVPVPSTVLPFINETVSPSGGAPALEVTAALKVAVCPEVDGFGEDESVVVGVASIAILTTKASGPPPLTGCKEFIVGKLVDSVAPVT